MQVQIHETLIANGYIAGEEVQSTLYWATRLADNLSNARKYDVMRRKLLEIIWSHFRVLGRDAHAITPSGIAALSAWTNSYLLRLPEKQLVDGRHFAAALGNLKRL